jgi:hypothetical protein
MASRNAESANFTRLLDRSMAVITSFVSSFMMGLIVSRPARVEITVSVFVLLAIWIMADRFLRRWLKTSVLMKENARWRDVILEVLDFLLMFGLFLTAQLLLHGLRGGIGSSELDSVEVVVFVLSLILGGFSILHTVKTLQIGIQ